MHQERIDELISVYRDGLLNDTLPFWTRHAVDRECGGFTMALNRDGSLLDSDKGVWQQGRFTWLLGMLYNTVEPREEWLELAGHGIDFITRHCFDDDGRMFFHLTREGKPIRKRRYAFSESFASIAYAAYARATDSGEHADRALATWNTFREWADGKAPGHPKFTDTRPAKGMGPPMISIVTCQELREHIGYEGADAVIDRCIEEIRRDFLKPEFKAVMETVGPRGEFIDHFDGRTLNPGHAIEGAWFILNEAKHRGGDRALIELGTTMLDWMWDIGWDREYGGILYFRDVHGLPVQEYWHDMKFWWPQNETIIATLLAYQLTGDAKYAEMHRKIHNWTYRYFPDPEYGEWYGYLHRDGRVSVPLKGNLWKGPFHMPRMQHVCWGILEELNAENPASGG